MWLAIEIIPDHFDLHKGKKFKSDHEGWGPHKNLFSALYYPLSWSNGFCSERGRKRLTCRKIQGTMVEQNAVLIFMIIFFLSFLPKFTLVQRKEEEKVKHEKYSPQNCPFWIYISNNQHIHFLVQCHLSWSTFALRLVRVPKALKSHYF